MPGPARERAGRREEKEKGGGGGGPREGRGPARGAALGLGLRDPRPLLVAAAAVSHAGSPGPLLGHRAPSTAVAAVAAAADSCSSWSRRLLPGQPARSPSSYRPPAEPREARSGHQPSSCQPAGPPTDLHPQTSVAPAGTRGPREYHSAEPKDLAGSPGWAPQPCPSFP